MTQIFILFWALFSGGKTFAAPTCFSDKASYEKVKSSLPAAMQKGSLFIVHNDPGSSLVAAAKITSTAKGFSFQMAYDHSFLGTTSEGGVIKKVCVSGGSVEVTLASGSKKTLSVAKAGFTYKGYTLKNTSHQTYDSVYASIMGGSDTASATKGKGKK